MILQELSDQVSDLRNTSDSYLSSCEEKRRQIGELYQKMIILEALVNDFQDSNEECLKILKSVGEELHGVLSNAKVLLRYALLSITESMRDDPERFRLIFYNLSSMIDYSSNDQDYSASCMYGH
jgi:hypothetical protein